MWCLTNCVEFLDASTLQSLLGTCGDLASSVGTYTKVKIAGGTPSALALRQFRIRNFKVEPWSEDPVCQEISDGSTYWISVEKIDNLACPNLGLWVLGRIDGVWGRLWDHDWCDNVDKGNEV